MREVIKYKKKAEEIVQELEKVKEQLAMSQETRKDLTKRVDHLMLEDQDRMEKDFRAVCECMLAELSSLKSVKNQLREALSTKINNVELIKQSAAVDIDQLRSKIIVLKAEAREDALRENMARSEEIRQLDMIWQNQSTLDLNILRSVDLDQCSQNRYVSGDSRKEDPDRDESTLEPLKSDGL